MPRTMLVLLAMLTIAASPLQTQVPDTTYADTAAVMAVAEPAVGLAGTYQGGYMEGMMQGRTVGTGGWWAAGFASGLVVPLIGNAVTYGLASSDGVYRPNPPEPLLVLYQDRDVPFHAGFQKGYRDAVLSKRKNAALVGGLAGTVTYGVLVMIMVVSLME
jgi:hypothetical protein